jgi:uncharacterized MAPEG superfamily protein
VFATQKGYKQKQSINNKYTGETSMTTLIIAALALALVQIWLLPMVLNLSNLSYLLSNRDEELKGSVITQRVQRAAANLQESLPAFLALALLAVYQQVDVSNLACAWLALRVAYLACYALGITFIRSGIFFASIVCLVMMALALL